MVILMNSLRSCKERNTMLILLTRLNGVQFIANLAHVSVIVPLAQGSRLKAHVPRCSREYRASNVKTKQHG